MDNFPSLIIKLIVDFLTYLKIEIMNKNIEFYRKFLSKKLMDTNEENQLKVYIPLENDESFGLSTLQLPTVISIWQHPSEGIIYFKFEGQDDYVEFDDMELEDIRQIIKEL
jgi:hypothetical protein